MYDAVIHAALLSGRPAQLIAKEFVDLLLAHGFTIEQSGKSIPVKDLQVGDPEQPLHDERARRLLDGFDFGTNAG